MLSSASLYVLEVPGANGAPSPAKAAAITVWKRKALSFWHLDVCPDEQDLSAEEPGRALLQSTSLALQSAKPVLPCPRTKRGFGDLCPHSSFSLL